MTNTKEIEVSKQQDAYVAQLLGRVMHHSWCDHKNSTPRKYPYVDAGSQDYANIAVRMLGYDEDAISELEAELRRLGDDVD